MSESPPSPPQHQQQQQQRLLAALFDIDGTLADTDAFHFGVFRDVLAPFGVEVDEAFFASSISGRANALIAADLLPHLGEDEARDLFIEKERLFRVRSEASLQPLGGLITLLTALRSAGIKTAAVTNAPRPNADMMLRVLGVREYFDHVVLGEELAEAKPSPLPYQTAMGLLGLDHADPDHHTRCVVFEDSLPGIKAGRAAGAVVVGVRTTQPDAVLREAGCTATIRDYTNVDIARLLSHLEDFVHPHDLSKKTAEHHHERLS